MTGQALAAFSADVEDYFQVEALNPFCPRSEWETFEDRVVPNTERVLSVLERTSSRGSFFVLGWIAERHPELVRKIADAGHEIASHGFGHELVYNLTPEEFRADIRRTRELLRSISGQDVIGYRAPSYTIMKRTQWALPILAEEGYRYDSSVFPIARRRYGDPDAPRWPHRVDVGGGRSLTEFPLPTNRIMGKLNAPTTGGAYLRLLPYGLQKRSVAGLVKSGRPFVVNVHPWELDPEQPRFPVGTRTRWTHYHNLAQTETRLEGLLGMAVYRPQAEVLAAMGLL